MDFPWHRGAAKGDRDQSSGAARAMMLMCNGNKLRPDVPGQEVRINGDRINGLFHLLVNGSYIGVSNYPLMLTFDPNFLPGTSK